MSKLSLHVDELVVQSFPTTDAEGGAGTVRGMDSGPSCDFDTCESCECTDMDTCIQNTCAASCPITCVTCPVSCYPANCPSSDGRC